MTKRTQGGFTLIELIIFIVVIGVGVAGVLSVFTTCIRNSADPMVRKQALAIAESLLEEIVVKEFKDPDGGTSGVSTCVLGPGSDRTVWRDVCQYNGYSSTGIRDAQGGSVSSLSGYSITSVAVGNFTLGGLTVKQIVVRVTDTQGNVTSLTGYRGDY